MSRVGIAMLFDRAGGSLTEMIRDEIKTVELKTNFHKRLMHEVRKEWNAWDLTEEQKNDDCLELDSFYNGFMAPYFGCYRCEDTKQALQAIDMDNDDKVDWSEFEVYLKWALHEYPEINSKTELIDKAFRKGLIPAMRDEVVRVNTPLLERRLSSAMNERRLSRAITKRRLSKAKTANISGAISRANTPQTSEKVSMVSSLPSRVAFSLEEVKVYDIE